MDLVSHILPRSDSPLEGSRSRGHQAEKHVSSLRGQIFPHHQAGFGPRDSVLNLEHTRHDLTVALDRLINKMKRVVLPKNVGARAVQAEKAANGVGAPEHLDAPDILALPWKGQVK